MNQYNQMMKLPIETGTRGRRYISGATGCFVLLSMHQEVALILMKIKMSTDTKE
jgi:hypothetical protein